MNIQDQSGLRFRLNENDLTASVISSPEANGNVLIPEFFEYKNIPYTVISIEKHAFSGDKINSIRFSKNSKVETFKSEAFYNFSIGLLYIPSSVKKIEPGCFFKVQQSFQINVSTRNPHFIYIDDNYLVQRGEDGFDTLIYVRSDIEDVLIPSSVKYIRPSSLSNCTQLKTLNFEENSQIESIQYGVLVESLEKFYIPKTLTNIDQICFQLPFNLRKIKVFKGNPSYRFVDPFLLKKSDGDEFDEIVFCRRDIDEVDIPKEIRKISSYSFTNCNNLYKIHFSSASILETIENYAFYSVPEIKKFTFPSSLRSVGSFAFSEMKNLEQVFFYSETIRINSKCFFSCDKLLAVSFSKAKNLYLDDSIPEKTSIRVLHDAELTCGILDKYKSQITYIENESNSDFDQADPNQIKKEYELKIQKLKKDYDMKIKQLEKEREKLKQELDETQVKNKELNSENIQLKKKLKKIEKNKSTDLDSDENGDVKKANEIRILDSDTFNCYKRIKRLKQDKLVYRVVKETYAMKEMDSKSQQIKKFIDDYKILNQFEHPNIIKVLDVFFGNEDNRPFIVLENCYDDLEDLVKNEYFTNVKAVFYIYQIVEGMKYAHSRNLIHRNLKPSNILCGYDGSIKISDFGISKLMSSKNQLKISSKDQLKFIAPELINEEEYDNKVDVYSFGTLVYFILSRGKLPTNKKPRIPTEFTMFSQNLINECWNPYFNDRPSFESISNEIEGNNYSLVKLTEKEMTEVKNMIEQHNEKIPSYST